MNMIRHDHITTYRHVEIAPSTLRKKNKRCMDLVLCQKPLSLMGAKCDEIKCQRLGPSAAVVVQNSASRETCSHGP